jgi:hypothetical protein
MPEKQRNAMQAALDRAAQTAAAELPVPLSSAARRSKPKTESRLVPPSRRNTQLVGGHFPRDVAKQLRLLAVEEDTTVQALLEEAIDLLLAKKARGRIAKST